MVGRFIAATTAPALMGAATGAVFDPNSFTGVFAQYGVLGLTALGGLWLALRTIRKTEESLAEAKAENSELQKDVRDRMIPALVTCNQLLGEVAVLLRERRSQ